MSRLDNYYGLHDPKALPIRLLLEFFRKYDVLAGEEIGGRQEVIFARLLFIILFVEASLIFLQVLVEHVLPAELVPPSKMVDPHVG